MVHNPAGDVTIASWAGGHTKPITIDFFVKKKYRNQVRKGTNKTTFKTFGQRRFRLGRAQSIEFL